MDKGCMKAQFPRRNWVFYLEIEWLDPHGKEQIDDIFDPFHARVVLHENDPLDGKIFLQRMKPEDFSELYWKENLDIGEKDLEQIKMFSKIPFKSLTAKKRIYDY